VLTFARRMESLGYDSLWASDHVVIPHRIESRYPYSPTGRFPLAPEVPFLEPLTTLALVAGVTERVQLGTSILVLPHRNPVLAAKMAATLDHLSGGRVVLGVGVGWMREEIELLGGDYDRRGAWSDEAIAVMRACWRDARTAHHGEFFSFEEIGVFPKPTRGDIPILIGGHTPRALRRVVELGDGWHAAFISPGALRGDIVLLREECARQQRPFEQLKISVRAGLSLRSAPLGADRKPLQGSRDQVIADLTAFRDLGVDSMLLETRYRDLPDMLSIYETFARDIRPRI
jgi:probable F420-dependent oxidoreductase